jgi:hypothetical protein
MTERNDNIETSTPVETKRIFNAGALGRERMLAELSWWILIAGFLVATVAIYYFVTSEFLAEATSRGRVVYIATGVGLGALTVFSALLWFALLQAAADVIRLLKHLNSLAYSGAIAGPSYEVDLRCSFCHLPSKPGATRCWKCKRQFVARGDADPGPPQE